MDIGLRCHADPVDYASCVFTCRLSQCTSFATARRLLQENDCENEELVLSLKPRLLEMNDFSLVFLC